jgi:hypothetical protein
MRLWFTSLLLLILTFVLAACGNDNTGEEDNSAAAVEAIENYWNARAELDEESLFQYSCAARESVVPGEIQSLMSVENLRLEGVDCRQTGTQGDDFIVTCDGMLVADYGAGDVNEFPLRSYLMTEENGEWKMCGEVTDPQTEEAG